MKYIALVLALFATTAMADNTAISGSASGSIANSGSNAAALQGNTQEINFNGSDRLDQRVHGTSTVRTAPTVYAPSFGTSSPCSLAVSGGVSVIGFGASFGKGYSDAECDRRETARVLHLLGRTDASLKVMCNNKEAAAALGDEICGLPEINPQ